MNQHQEYASLYLESYKIKLEAAQLHFALAIEVLRDMDRKSAVETIAKAFKCERPQAESLYSRWKHIMTNPELINNLKVGKENLSLALRPKVKIARNK